MAAQDFLKYSSPIFCKVLNRFSECYLLKVTRSDRGTDIQTYCNNASQVSNASEIDISGYKQCRNVNSLPNSVSVVSRQDTRMWVISQMTNITVFPCSILSGVRLSQPWVQRITENIPRG